MRIISEPPKWTIEFYRDRRDNSPVEQFLDKLQPKEKAKAIMYLDLLRDYGIGISKPYVKDLTGHKPVWELLPDPIRLIYFAYTGRRFIILHGFRKKNYKTRMQDIETAENRRNDFLERQK